MNSAFARIYPSIACSSAALSEEEGKSSAVSRAYNLKKYRCSPEGGHGPPQPVFPKLVVPSTAPAGTLCSGIERVSGAIFHSVQCTQMPAGASGSSTINARESAPSGTPENSSGGFTSSPSQV